MELRTWNLSSDGDIDGKDATELKAGEGHRGKDIEAEDKELRTSNLSSDGDIEAKDSTKLKHGKRHRAKNIEAKDMELRTLNLSSDGDIEAEAALKLRNATALASSLAMAKLSSDCDIELSGEA